MAGFVIAAVVLAPGGALAQAPNAPKTAAPATPASASPKVPPTPEKAREERGQPVTVDADNMERLGRESLIIFTGKVVARQEGSVQYSDRMEVYLDEKGDRILRTVSTGNVKIVTRDCRVGTARRAEYDDLEQRLVLIGDARIWQGDDVVTGDTITIFLSQDRSVAQAGRQSRVKLVFHPKQQDETDATPVARRSCE